MKNFWTIFRKRLFSTALILFLITSFIFLLLRIAPGDPTQRFLSPELSPLLLEKVKKSFLLDRTIFEQYVIFIKNIFLGDFGISYNYRMPVISVISNTLPFTLIFSSISIGLQISISLLLILFISQRRNSFFDRLLNKLNLFFYSIPTMIVGMFLIYIFSLQLNLLPMSDLHSIYLDNVTTWEKLFDYFKHMILPLATLSLPGIIVFYGYLRNNIDEVYKKSFVLFLRGCGMNESKIFKNHVLPNSVEPLISVLGTELGILLGGALITENIFGLPGMGRLIVDAILTRDYPLVVGSVFVSTILVLIANMLADFVKVIINKKLAADYF